MSFEWGVEMSSLESLSHFESHDGQYSLTFCSKSDIWDAHMSDMIFCFVKQFLDTIFLKGLSESISSVIQMPFNDVWFQ